MKYRFIILFLWLFAAGVSAQESAVVAPKYSERQAGSAELSGGIYWGDFRPSAAAESLSAFFAGQGIDVNRAHAARKNTVLTYCRTALIDGIPEDAENGYALKVAPGRITVEFQTPQAEEQACRQLMALFEKRVVRQGVIRRSIALPCYEIRSWTNETASDCLFRNQTVPAAGEVVLRLVDPAKGWVGAGTVLSSVGYHQPLCPDPSFSYADVDREIRRMTAEGSRVLPLFDLVGRNECFETVTGHPMLSVEGMRFVRMLLDAYFTHTRFPSVGFVVPEGRYREQVRRIVARYPYVTDLRFLDE